MANESTQEFWAVDGVPLQTFAQNISTWGDTRQAPPPMRGDDLTIPHAVGQRWLPKQVEGRTITLQMWVSAANPDGTIPALGQQRANFVANWNALRQLLWNPYREFVLTKRIQYPGDTAWTTVTAKAQYTGGMAPQMHSDRMATFSTDLFLADPYFYGPEISAGSTILGDARTYRSTITLGAGVRLTNNTNSVWVQNTFGSTATLDVFNFKALAGGVKCASAISHSGDKYWMALDPGPVSLTGGGSVTYQPAWF